jgi:hypothetical protein
MFDIEVTRTASGTYAATCRDLHLACEADTLGEALHRMQSLVFFYLSAPADVAHARQTGGGAGATKTEQKLVCIPPKERIQ